jgi:hypothetical protein
MSDSRLSWNEIRTRASDFAKEWKEAGYERGQTGLFYQHFFEVFGVSLRRVATFEEPVKLLEREKRRGFLDLFWKGVLLVEQKSAGHSLAKAKQQAFDYFPGIKEKDLPQYVLVSDFQSFILYDLDNDTEVAFPLSLLRDNVEHFGFILGVQKRTFKDQDPVNVEAAELVGKLHDALTDSGYTGDKLQQFLVRLVFCLFADDTGIFDTRGEFLDYLESHTAADGSDVGSRLAELFQVLNTPEEERSNRLDEELARFPYVNGELFAGTLSIPSFDSAMRKALIDAARFDWSNISPAIFGSMFQSILDAKKRRELGAHYTSEASILKVVQPLFLDALHAEFARLQRNKSTTRQQWEHFQQGLGKLTFFDPACGAGNFLIITYRELRELELATIHELRQLGRSKKHALQGEQLVADISTVSVVNVDQFYGIEIDAFAAKIAETALWMMDHIMNVRLGIELGQHYIRIPLRKTPLIQHGDALETDWNDVLPSAKCSYMLGNPPFGGSKFQTEGQRQQVRRIAALGGSGGSLDFVTAWYFKAGAYIKGTPIHVGFVSTNSITQGEQVAQLWRPLYERYGIEITFAHRTFAWGSDARGKAAVHVVIIGFSEAKYAPTDKRLFSYSDLKGSPTESIHRSLSPYLIDASALNNPHTVVDEVAQPINGLPRPITGTQPIDDGNFIFSEDDMHQFVADEPGASSLFRPFIGAEDFLHGNVRYALHLADASPAVLAKLPKVKERIAAVRSFREKSKRVSTKKAALTPASFGLTVVPTSPFLVLPQVSSERRDYIPIAWLNPPIIPSEKLRLLSGAKLWHFALLTSAMHMAWVRCITGRLKSDYMYSIGVVYNTFPVPELTMGTKEALSALAQEVLNARSAHTDATLADLYDPDAMPNDLRKAHAALDRAVDKLYRAARFTSDRERAEHLLNRYEAMTAPLLAKPAPKRRK